MPNYLIITGASKGIGHAAASAFIDAGWHVINLSRTTCDVEGVDSLTVDLTHSDLSAQLQQKLLPRIQKVNKICLVHNAALYAGGNIKHIDLAEYEKSLRINLVAPLVLNQLLLPMMSAGSSILYIGSTLSEKAVANAAPYVIAKHGVIGMMRSTCQDLDNTGIHTAAICPGFTDTEMLRSHLDSNPEILKAITSNICARRLIKPEEIASLIHYCAENPVINGSILHANLGQVER